MFKSKIEYNSVYKESLIFEPSNVIQKHLKTKNQSLKEKELTILSF